MREKIYVHHHLGLGDHIVCNAIVRSLRKKHGPVLLAVKKENYISVKQLYRDIDVSLHQVTCDNDCHDMYQKYPSVRVGFENLWRRNTDKWEEAFYDQMGVDYSERFTGFHIDRDYDKEKALEEILNIPKEFAFCNTSTSRGCHQIEINTGVKKIFLEQKTDSIFDWIGVIEKASEIHTVDSAIFQLIKQLDVKGKKIFYDVRGSDPSRTAFTVDPSWIIK
jgi:hypothetical protein